MANYTFDPQAGHYVDSSGEKVALEAVTGVLWEDIDASREEIARICQLFTDGAIILNEWAARMRQEIEGAFARAFVLGAGGEEAANEAPQEDFDTLAKQIGLQYDYLDRFYLEIEAGTEESITGRAQMYGSAAQQAFWHELGMVMRRADFLEERWVLGVVQTEHCDDCPRLAREGWVEIGTHPQPGDGFTRCLSNCRCHKEYKHSSGRVY